MKKNILFLLLLGCVTLTTYSQSNDTLLCDKTDRDTSEFENLPWFGNNDYLENFLDSIGYPAGGGGFRIVGPDREPAKVLE